MRFSKTLAAIFLCAATLTLPTAANAATTRPSQKPRASKAQTPAPQTEITKEKIEAIVAAYEEAAKTKGIAVIVSYLAPDLKVKLVERDLTTRQVNRAEYIEMMKRGFENMLDYTYLRKSLTVTIAPDGQSATAQVEAFEMLTVAQGTVAGTSLNSITFKIYKGKILIASMEGTITYV
jgi:hypothetical protein